MSNSINWTKPLIPIPNTMLNWHKKYCSYTYILSKKKFFLYFGWVQTRSDDFIRTIRRRYLFPDPLSMWLLISMKFSTNLIIPQNYWFNTNQCARWVHTRDCSWNMSREIFLLNVTDGQMINLHFISDQKKPNLNMILTNIK